jgi:hypothetical protein
MACIWLDNDQTPEADAIEGANLVAEITLPEYLLDIFI